MDEMNKSEECEPKETNGHASMSRAAQAEAKVHRDPNYRPVIAWRYVFFLSWHHILAIYALYWMLSDSTVSFGDFLLLDLLVRTAMMGMGASAHRYWAHRSYKARLPLRIVLMLLQTYLYQWDILVWCRNHRLHHKFSDTDADIHNSQRGLFHSHIGWIMVRKHPEAKRLIEKIPVDDLWADPVVRFQHRFYYPLVGLVWGLAPTVLYHQVTGHGWLASFLVAVELRFVISMHYTFVINSLAHTFGVQIYDRSEQARESRLVSYLSHGEGYHNYHHTFPMDYAAAEFGWREGGSNLSQMFIDACAAVGLAYDLKKVNPKIIRARMERTGDLELHRKFWGAERMSTAAVVFDHLLGLVVSNWMTVLFVLVRIYRAFG